MNRPNVCENRHSMKLPIRTAADLGVVIRAVRKDAGVRQDDLAGMVGVSRQFAVDAERGKPTIQLAKVLRLLEELGVELSVELGEGAASEYHRLQNKRRDTQRWTQQATE